MAWKQASEKTKALEMSRGKDLPLTPVMNRYTARTFKKTAKERSGSVYTCTRCMGANAARREPGTEHIAEYHGAEMKKRREEFSWEVSRAEGKVERIEEVGE